MRSVVIQGTSGQPKMIALGEEVRTKADLLPILSREGIDTTGMEMVDVKTSTSLVLPEAVLPTNDFMLVLAPVKIKGNSDIPELPTVDAVANMEYVEVRGELKKLKAYAVDADNEELEEIIGNYSSIKVPEMKERLIAAINFLRPPVPVSVAEAPAAVAVDLSEIENALAQIRETLAGFENRVVELEGRLGIINPYNVHNWDERVRLVQAAIAKARK